MGKQATKVSHFALAILLAVTMEAFSSPARASSSASSGPVVRIASGRVLGATINGLEVFKGIPYAQPPVGKLRWEPPHPAKLWKGVRPALDYGHDCMQSRFPHDAAPLRTPPGEDCLYLNVWAPAHPTRPMPVIVWIYGGGFVNGGSSPTPYGGAAFAHRGLVFVSFNYRLGRFGFFAFPALTRKGGLLGNYGFMDQIAALKWVQHNIAAFGGNPHEVTIFGESAGGISVNVLLTSPMARGLFERAMIESGGGRFNDMIPPLDHPGPHGQPSAEQDGIAFAEEMGIHGTGDAALAALRRLPAEKIVNGINMASMGQQRKTYSGPMIDGKLLAQSPEQVYKEGKEAKVPVVVGANSLDIGFARAKTFDELFAPFGDHEAAAKEAFDPSGNKGNFKKISEHVAAVEFMIEPASFVARTFARAGEPAYEYRFSYVAHALPQSLSGAPHSSEIPYVFDTIRKSKWGNFGKGITSDDLRVASQANEYWANFAKTGNPNGPGLPQWHRITAEGNQLLNFTMKGPKPETDPWKNQLNLVKAIQP